MVFQKALLILKETYQRLLGYLTQYSTKSIKEGKEQERANPQSVRSASSGKKVGGRSLAGKMSAAQWGQARVYSFVMKRPGTWGKADKDLADKVKAKKIKGYTR